MQVEHAPAQAPHELEVGSLVSPRASVARWETSLELNECQSLLNNDLKPDVARVPATALRAPGAERGWRNARAGCRLPLGQASEHGAQDDPGALGVELRRATGPHRAWTESSV